MKWQATAKKYTNLSLIYFKEIKLHGYSTLPYFHSHNVVCFFNLYRVACWSDLSICLTSSLKFATYESLSVYINMSFQSFKPTNRLRIYKMFRKPDKFSWSNSWFTW